jgi:Fibronectin type III domain/Secretion system C-terminal sorting domain
LVRLGSLNLSNNRFTFDGMELIAQKFPFAVYSPQAIMPVYQNNEGLSVSTGGTLSNNTYKWYQVGEVGNTTVVGDSVFQPSQSGKYFAAVTNSICTKLTLNTDTISFGSSIPYITAVTDINSSQAVVHWYPVTNASSYKVRAYPSGTTKYKYYGYETPINDTFKKIVNLQPATGYKVEVMAIFNGGTDSTGWSVPFGFTTQGNCNPPTGLSVTNITGTGARLNWSSPVTEASHYELRMRKTGNTAWRAKPVKPTKEYFDVMGLSPNTSYQWQLRSGCINISDKSNWANGPAFTTTSAIAFSSNPASVTGNNIGNTAVQVMPNPSNGNFTLQMQLPAKEAATTIALYNSLGVKVWQQQAGILSGTVTKSIALENKLATGIYVLYIERSDMKLVQKIVVSK